MFLIIIHTCTTYMYIHVYIVVIKSMFFVRKIRFFFSNPHEIVQHSTIYLIRCLLICFKNFQEFFTEKIKHSVVSKEKQINTVALLYILWFKLQSVIGKLRFNIDKYRTIIRFFFSVVY